MGYPRIAEWRCNVIPATLTEKSTWVFYRIIVYLHLFFLVPTRELFVTKHNTFTVYFRDF